MVLATRSDSLGDFDRELKRRGRLKTRYPGLAAGARALNERDELLLQGFLAFNCNFIACNLSAFASIDFAAMFFVIEREISVFLKNADLAHPLGADPARRYVRDATVFEMDARIGNVFAFAQNRNPDRVDALHRRAHKMQNNFEVVDHQIENDANVGAAIWIRREPMRFDKARMGESCFERAQDQIEALDLANLQK